MTELPSWIIRTAHSRDADALHRCIDAAYERYVGEIDGLPSFSDGVEDDIEAQRVWVAELDEMIVGGLFLIFSGRFAVLANVAVDPSATGLGLGRTLIERAEQECRKRGLPELRLNTHIHMPENVSLYEYLGWQETGRSGNKVNMTKWL